MYIEFLPLRPALDGPFLERFYKTIPKIIDCEGNGFERTIQKEVDWAVDGTSVNPRQRRIYRATWLFLRDLLRAGWICRWYEGTFEIAPPYKETSVKNHHDIQREKNTIRNAMRQTRIERALEAREFINRMENPNPAGIAKIPITKLVADGESLYKDLQTVKRSKKRDTKLKAINKIIDPYLQLVEENKRCSETGHKLSDIWRYFRFTWVTPAETIPGRTMLYLVRDAARPYHPIMGIAALGNAPVLIQCRDTFLGWTIDSFKDEILKLNDVKSIKRKFQELIRKLSLSINEISVEGLCTKKERRYPNTQLLHKLDAIASRSIGEREEALKEWRERDKSKDNESEAIERSELGNISKAAEDALYRRKRADQLRQLLDAQIILKEFIKKSKFQFSLKNFIDSEIGQKAIRTAIKAPKNRHIGTSILEMNVCGAIPPYNEILGGKLVALMILSPKVIDDYRIKYGSRPSDIASRMKGEKVIRPADLLFIETTSLYQHGSSQYNRLKLPNNLMKQDGGEVRWLKLGKTAGYGTLHISRPTLQAFEEVVSSYKDLNVNSIFGEGASPKLRKVRVALDILLGAAPYFAQEELRKHSMSRIVYGAMVASNAKEILRGESNNPVYFFNDDEDPNDGTSKIVQFWKERWLLKRISYKAAIDRIKIFKPEQVLVSSELRQENITQFVPIPEEVQTMQNHESNKSDDWREFVRDLYRGTSAYADGIDSSFLSTLHVPTKLDKEIKRAVLASKSVILTGNPGDGKTHLLRVISESLNNSNVKPFIELDASAKTNEELIKNWKKAVKEKRPFCVAINEAVLFSLSNENPDFEPLVRAINQVDHSILYGNENHDIKDEIVVFDLSRRNVLAEEIVNAAIDKLTDKKLLKGCSSCPSKGCDLTMNVELLSSRLVRKRVQSLLNRVSRRGYHATLRELLGFISYLLLAGRKCDTLLKDSFKLSYSFPQLFFSGQGEIFNILRQTFDPAKITHPVWDDVLINAETEEREWFKHWHIENDSIDPVDIERFTARKRAFFFCHEKGEELLKISADDESEFANFMETTEREALRLLIRRINSFFGVESNSDALNVWQSHRYNQSPRKVLYSSIIKKRIEFQILRPKLINTMAHAFDLAQDHVLLCLKSRNNAKLRVDFNLFELLAKADRGFPVMSLEHEATRRLWQFMEKLTDLENEFLDEMEISIFDPTSGDHLKVSVDRENKQYLTIDRVR